MRKPLSLVAGATLGALIAAGCGGTPTASSLPTIPPINVPSFALPTIPPLPSGMEIPSFEIPSFSIPSFPPDPAIVAAFPAQIDGQPLSEIESANFLAAIQVFATPEQVQQFMAGMQAINITPASVAFGSATATVDDNPVQIQLFRFPGGDARAALDVLVRIDEPETPPVITTETIGGKSVTLATVDGDPEYYYLNGEWAWFLPSAERSEAEVVFAALP